MNKRGSELPREIKDQHQEIQIDRYIDREKKRELGKI